MNGRVIAAVALCGLVLVAASGCAAALPSSTPGTGSSGHTPTLTLTPSVTPSPVPIGFFVPPSCLEVVTQDRLDLFASQGLTLQYGPGSASGALLDRYPVEDEVGDIQCLWGTPSLSASVEIDIGPMTDAVRPTVIAHLETLFLSTTTDGEVVRYFADGEQLLAYDIPLPARVDILRPVSWITVLIEPGGPAPYDLAQSIATEAAALSNAD